VSGFERHKKSGRVIATFSGFEADLLRSLASQMVELLRNERAEPAVPTADPFEKLMSEFSGATTIPEDPVLARLFPTAYPADSSSSGLIIDTLEEAGLPPELTEEGLVIDVELTPDEVELTPDEAETWMRAFTDIRLALATRLGVEAGDDAYWHSLPDDDPRAQAHDIYEWVGYLQETVVEALGS
jgi:hypothetical protein